MKFLKVFVVFAVATAALASSAPHPLSEENIALINQKQSTWTAGKNFEVSDWERVKKLASGILPRKTPLNKAPNVNPHNESENVPETFDARETWPICDTIKQIRDQSDCGSCWAFGAVEAMSDRICIHSNQSKQVYISADDLIGCCSECGWGCEGGFITQAWSYWQETGIVTGGLYNSSQGCKDYSLPPCEHFIDGDKAECSTLDLKTPECVKSCYDNSLNYKESLTYGEDVSVFLNAKQMQLEIYKNGPIEAVYAVYDDFPSYKSGVYQATSDNNIGYHAIKILGWGVENGVDYWLVANSWNTDWGDEGFFKILRGVNECKIEAATAASLPKL